MKTPSRTPGPWSVLERCCGRLVIDSPNGVVAAITFNDAAGKLDAALIAAAPDLLAACNAELDAMIREDFGTITLLPRLRTAIAKAEGRS